MLTAEEIGELFFIIRKNIKGGTVVTDSTVGNVKHELTDVLIYLCSIASQHIIDLRV